MRLPVRAALLVIVLTVLFASAAPARSSVFAQAEPEVGWVSLGPPFPIDPHGFGVSTGWPDDPFIIVRLHADQQVTPPHLAMRTFNGGRTWEPLTEAPPARLIRVVQTASGHVIFALADQARVGPNPNETRQVYRSVDEGVSWSPVFEVNGGEAPRLVLSPSVRDDGHAFLLDGGRLYATSDYGATWTQRSPHAEQLVYDFVISPSFATDRKLYAAVNSAGFSVSGNEYLPTAHAESMGVMVSRDAGVTWTEVSEGPSIGDERFRHVQALAISPAFAEDRTLFAYAWGPLERFEGGAAKWKHTALFRSQDAGLSWQVVWQPDYRPYSLPGGFVWSFRTTLRPFPTFGEDGRIALSIQSSGGSPSSGSCRYIASEDGGNSWNDLRAPFSLPACTDLQTVPDLPTAVVVNGVRGGMWNETHVVTKVNTFRIRPSAGQPHSSVDSGKAASTNANGSLFFGTSEGLWMLPSRAISQLAAP